MVSLRTPQAETSAEKLLKQAVLRDTCTLVQGRTPEARSHLRLYPCVTLQSLLCKSNRLLQMQAAMKEREA